MDQKMRVECIRRGNEFFNNGDIDNAEKLFVKAEYRDGLTRIADYYFFDKKQPLVALRFYQMVKRDDKVKEIFERMAFAFGKLLGKKESADDPDRSQRVELPPLKVSPKLKIFAEEILRDNQAKQDSE